MPHLNKIGIYASMDNGLVKDKSIDYIGADKGVIHLINQNIKPIIAIGDFDSLKDLSIIKNIKHITYPVKKDKTDLELCIDYALSLNYQSVDIYGAIGGRIDHFFNALTLLEKYKDINITLIDSLNTIKILKKGTYNINVKRKYFSLFALDNSYITINNAMYNLDNYLLKRSDGLCVSNQGKTIKIITSDLIYYIESDDKEFING